MRTKYLVAGMAILLILSLGTAIAISPGNGGGEIGQADGKTAQPISTAVTGTQIVKFWDSGTHGFLRTEPDSPGTLGKQISAADITIPSGATARFITPLELPSVVNGQPTSVKKIFLEWNATSACTITNVQVFSGFFFFDGAGGFPTNFVGTGSVQDLTLDLGGNFPVSHGLSMQWSIHNSAGSPQIASIYAYGARVNYLA